MRRVLSPSSSIDPGLGQGLHLISPGHSISRRRRFSVRPCWSGLWFLRGRFWRFSRLLPVRLLLDSPRPGHLRGRSLVHLCLLSSGALGSSLVPGRLEVLLDVSFPLLSWMLLDASSCFIFRRVTIRLGNPDRESFERVSRILNLINIHSPPLPALHTE